MAPVRGKSQLVGIMGNFAVGYNLQSASIALTIAGNVWPKPGWVAFVSLGTPLAGIIAGMLTMGYLGDRIGRRAAMCTTTAITCTFVAASAFFSVGDAASVYIIFSTARFFTGYGIGGVYPLAAVSAAESVDNPDDMGQQIAKAFLWQAPAQMSPSLIALALTWIAGPGRMEMFIFRTVLAIGLIPASVVFLAAFYTEDSKDFQSNRVQNPFQKLLENSGHKAKLIAGSGSWCLYNFAFFGTTLFTPRIVESIVCTAGREHCSLHNIILGSATTASCALPGMILAVANFKRMGCRRQNLVGFSLLAILFFVFGCTFQIALPQEKVIRFVMLGLVIGTLYSANCVATYVYPAIAFPAEVRSSASGMCGMCGKCGALAGAFVFPAVAEMFGQASIFFIQTIVCLAAYALCWFLQKDLQHSSWAPLVDAAKLS